MSGILGSLYRDFMIPELDYEHYAFGIPYRRAATPSGTFVVDKDRCKLKQQHRFVIKGVEIMASSRKDAIKKYNHLKNK